MRGVKLNPKVQIEWTLSDKKAADVQVEYVLRMHWKSELLKVLF